MNERTCAVCSASIAHRSSRAKYCSQQCRDWLRHHPGEPIPKAGRSCRQCGSGIDERRLEVRYCSLLCQRRFLGGVPHRDSAICAECGTSFAPKHAAQRYCTGGCRDRACARNWYRANLEHARAQRRGYNQRTGAGTAGTHRYLARKRRQIVEQFTNREIFERDGWECRVCGDSVDQSVRWPHPLSATLDHILPVSKGGPHARSNVQLAHAFCNLSKSDGEVERAVASFKARRIAHLGLDRARLDDGVSGDT